MQNPDWSDLHVFLQVHRAGTLSGAGRALGVYPSTVGRRLDALEAAMGTLLFQRTSEGLVPTSAADEMLDAAEVMERQAHLISQRLSGESGALRGSVKLATTPDAAVYFLIERLSVFRERHPGIEVDVLSSVGFVDVARGEADIALRFTRGLEPPVPKAQRDVLLARRSTPVGIGLYASRDYLQRRGRPSSSRDLAGHDLVRPSESWVPGYQWIIDHEAGTSTVLCSDTLAGLGMAARCGYGIAPLPSFMAFAHDELERIRPPDRIGVVQTWLIMPRDLRRVARVRAFWEFLLEVFDEWEALLSGED